MINMKQITLIMLICLIATTALFAQDYDDFDDYNDNDIMSGLDYLEEEGDLVDMGLWLPDRGFEIGFANVDIFFATNFIPIGNVFREKAKININKFPEIFKIKTGLTLIPLYFSYDSKKGWGFGLSTEVQLTGFTGININLKNITDAKNKKSDLNLATYVNIQPSAFFNIYNFNVSVKPTLYFPVTFMKSDVSYTLNGSERLFRFDYDVSLFTAFNLDDYDGLTFSPGFDLSFSAEYPLSKELGIENIFPILNFDVGACIIGMPVVPGKLNDYMKITGYFEADADNLTDIETTNTSENIYGTESIRVFRPFSLHTYANWRPLGSLLITVTPLLGFTINPLYSNVFSLDGGITGHLNLYNIFHVKLGFNYLDRLMINSLDLSINSRAFEFCIGGDLRSQRFGGAWNGSGFGVRLAMKFGW